MDDKKLKLLPDPLSSQDIRKNKYKALQEVYSKSMPDDFDISYFKLPITGDNTLTIRDKQTGLPLFSAVLEPVGEMDKPSSYKLSELRKPFFKDSESFLADPSIVKKAMSQAGSELELPIVKGQRRAGSSAANVFEKLDMLNDIDLPESNVQNVKFGSKLKALPYIGTAAALASGDATAAIPGLDMADSLGEGSDNMSDSYPARISKSMEEDGYLDPVKFSILRKQLTRK